VVFLVEIKAGDNLHLLTGVSAGATAACSVLNDLYVIHMFSLDAIIHVGRHTNK
jgi:hypothetical protein